MPRTMPDPTTTTTRHPTLTLTQAQERELHRKTATQLFEVATRFRELARAVRREGSVAPDVAEGTHQIEHHLFGTCISESREARRHFPETVGGYAAFLDAVADLVAGALKQKWS